MPIPFTNDEPDTDSDDRRAFLRTVGAVGVAGVLAGCLADDDADDSEAVDDSDDTDDADDTADGDDQPVTEGLRISNLDPADYQLTADRQVTVSATIENPSPEPDAELVEYRIDGDALESEPVMVDGEAEEEITFEADLTGYQVGEYDHGIFGESDEATGTLTIPSFGPPTPPKEDYEDLVGLHPEDAAESFSVAPGFEVELVASEPLIDTPVDVRWDASGRMWVCQFPDYMGIYPGDGRGGSDPGNWPDGIDHAENDLETLTGWGDSVDDEPPNGSITVLEDIDGDGYYDESTTFIDNLTMARALCLVEADDALLVAHAGRNVNEADLFLCRDTDGDGVSDERIDLKNNWVHQTNAEHTSNGLEFMLDNWIHSSNASERFQVRGSSLAEEDDTSTYGQWGLTEDIYGRTYHTRNTTLLRGDRGPEKGQNTSNLGDGSIVHPIRPNRGTNRYYVPVGGSQDGWSNFHREDDRLRNATSTSGPGAYLGGLFPDEYVNDVFSPEPQSNLVTHFRLTDQSGSLGISSEHMKYQHTSENNPYDGEELELDEVEFLASWDEIFRPVNVRTGPDGALYIVDMYNGLTQQWLYLTAYLADYYYRHTLWAIDNLEHGSGRVWRVYPEGEELEQPPDLSEASSDELVSYLDSDNGWVRKTAQRLLVQGEQTTAASALRDLAQDDDATDVGRMHALLTLHGLDEIDGESVFAVFNDVENSHVLANAIRVGEALYGTDDGAAYESYLNNFADDSHDRISTQAEQSLE